MGVFTSHPWEGILATDPSPSQLGAERPERGHHCWVPKEDLLGSLRSCRRPSHSLRAGEVVKGGDRRAGFCHRFIRHAEDNSSSEKPLTLASAEVGPWLAEEVKR